MTSVGDSTPSPTSPPWEMGPRVTDDSAYPPLIPSPVLSLMLLLGEGVLGSMGQQIPPLSSPPLPQVITLPDQDVPPIPVWPPMVDRIPSASYRMISATDGMSPSLVGLMGRRLRGSRHPVRSGSPPSSNSPSPPLTMPSDPRSSSSSTPPPRKQASRAYVSSWMNMRNFPPHGIRPPMYPLRCSLSRNRCRNFGGNGLERGEMDRHTFG